MLGLTAAAFAYLMRKATAPQTWLETDLAAARRDPGVDWVVVPWGVANAFLQNETRRCSLGGTTRILR